MIAVLGKGMIDRLVPGDKPYEVRDVKLKGLLLRVQPSGVRTYYCEYQRGRRVKIGRADAVSIDTARREAGKVMGQAYAGADPIAERRKQKSSTYREFLKNHYTPWVQANRKDANPCLDRIKTCFSQFMDRPLLEITALEVEKWRNDRLDAGRTPNTVNRDLSDLKASLNRAVDWGIIAENPLARVKPFKIDTAGKVRFLTEAEETRLRNALDTREAEIRLKRKRANEWRRERNYDEYPDLANVPFADYLKPMALISINTGMRRGEMFDLTWENVDLDNRIVTIEGATAKSKRTRHIPLNTEAHAVLTDWQSQSDAQMDSLVFTNAEGKRFNHIKRSWAAVLKIAKIENFRWHDLRHHFASKLVMAHVNLNTVRELLGHADYKMTLRYAHLAPEHKHAAVDTLCA